MVRVIGKARADIVIGMRNLVYNMSRFGFLRRRGSTASFQRRGAWDCARDHGSATQKIRSSTFEAPRGAVCSRPTLNRRALATLKDVNWI